MTLKFNGEGEYTALITGASSGIGAEFARQLAKKGFNLVVTARRKEKLDELALSLSKNHNIDVQPLIADLNEDSHIEMLEDKISNMQDLLFLVNNAGFGTHGHFIDVDVKKHVSMMKVHNTAMVRLCHAALPQMIKRKNGGIINVASTGAFLAYPYNTMYGATKCFIDFFSRSLMTELEGTGVKVQSLCPGMTYTEFHDSPEFKKFERSKVPKFLWMKAEKVVESSLNALEKSNNVTFIPGFINRILKACSNVPGFANLLASAE